MANRAARASYGDRTVVESYLKEHPGLRARPRDLLDLIYNEIVLRELNGESPDLDQYSCRFPDVARQGARVLVKVCSRIDKGE